MLPKAFPRLTHSSVMSGSRTLGSTCIQLFLQLDQFILLQFKTLDSSHLGGARYGIGSDVHYIILCVRRLARGVAYRA